MAATLEELGRWVLMTKTFVSRTSHAADAEFANPRSSLAQDVPVSHEESLTNRPWRGHAAP